MLICAMCCLLQIYDCFVLMKFWKGFKIPTFKVPMLKIPMNQNTNRPYQNTNRPYQNTNRHNHNTNRHNHNTNRHYQNTNNALSKYQRRKFIIPRKKGYFLPFVVRPTHPLKTILLLF